jgi:hypothetical protein
MFHLSSPWRQTCRFSQGTKKPASAKAGSHRFSWIYYAPASWTQIGAMVKD